MSEGESGPQKGLLEPTQQEVTVDRDSTGRIATPKILGGSN